MLYILSHCSIVVDIKVFHLLTMLELKLIIMTDNCPICNGIMVFHDVCFEDDGAIAPIFKCENRCDLDYHDQPNDLLEEEEPPFDLPF